MKEGNAVNVPLLARGPVSPQQAPMESFWPEMYQISQNMEVDKYADFIL